MLYIDDDKSIHLTRGDSAYITFPLFVHVNGLDDTPYTMDPADTLTLSVKKTTKDSEYIFQRVLTGSNTFHILPSDTKDCDFRKYIYDVQLVTSIAGDVYTVVPPTVFEVLSEVTD